ncbi:MAG: DNA primase [Firmicutes bacterium]|nr:DNA primase [Bacillota bacterium]
MSIHNRGFPTEWLEQLKSRNDIVTTVSRYIPLTKKGKLYWGACPFHFEKTPSMAVNEAEQFYHCFGCGASGDVISFVEKQESVDFWEAVKILAKSAGMELPMMVSSDAIREKAAKKDLYLKILKEAARHYRDNLAAGRNKAAAGYLDKRKINQGSIARFGIGASIGFNQINEHLLALGYKLQDCLDAGVLDKNDKGDFYDSYSNRLIFPLINSYGDVVGFSGRLLEDKELAKYKNTRDTLTFDKSKTVFGINLIKQAKQKNDLDSILVVEGQIDVITLHQAGFRSAVACLGTALTPGHVKELKRFSNNIVLCFDGDEAGKKAAQRSIDIILAEGLSCKVAVLPDGFDPDDYLNRHGKEAFTKLLGEAIEANDYKLKMLAAKFDLSSNEQKARFVTEAIKMLKGMNLDSEREIYLKVVSGYSGISLDVLRKDLNAEKSPEPAAETDKPGTAAHKDAYTLADIFIVASLLHKKQEIKPDDLQELEFIHPDIKTVFNYVKTTAEAGNAPRVSGVFDICNAESLPIVLDIINYNFETSKFNFKECLIKNKQRTLQIVQAELHSEFEASSDMSRRKEIIIQLNEINKQLQKLKNDLQVQQAHRRED